MSIVSTREYYDRISPQYNSIRDNAYHRWLIREQLKLTRRFLSGHILDAGCGSGIMLPACIKQGLRITATDLSQEMLRQPDILQFPRIQSDIHTLPFRNETFDGVMAWKVLPHCDRPCEVLGEFSRVTKPGGIILAEFYNRRSIRFAAQKCFISKSRFTDNRPELFVRFDDLASIRSHIPASLELVEIVGYRTVIAAGGLCEIPFLGGILLLLDGILSAGIFRRWSGFLVLVLRRH